MRHFKHHGSAQYLGIGVVGLGFHAKIVAVSLKKGKPPSRWVVLHIVLSSSPATDDTEVVPPEFGRRMTSVSSHLRGKTIHLTRCHLRERLLPATDEQWQQVLGHLRAFPTFRQAWSVKDVAYALAY